MEAGNCRFCKENAVGIEVQRAVLSGCIAYRTVCRTCVSGLVSIIFICIYIYIHTYLFNQHEPSSEAEEGWRAGSGCKASA